MRKFIYLLSVTVLALASCNNNNKYTITGKVEGAYDGEKVFLMERVNREFVQLDSALIYKGKFKFEGEQSDPVNRYIAFTDGENDPIYLDFFLTNGDIEIFLAENPDKSNVKGGTITNAYEAFKYDMKSVGLEMKELYSVLADPSLSEEERVTKRKELEQLEGKQVDVIKKGITKNANSLLGVYLLNGHHYYMDYDEIEALLGAFPATLQEDSRIVALNERVEIAKNTAVGKKFADLEMLTPEGEPIKLSDYVGKGKVVLIDFWASWCGPCRREMPRLVDMYVRYKDKGFEIVGVSFDRDGESWKKGIEQLDITWPQMSDLKYWESEGAAVYAIRSIPHVVLVDGEGVIVSRGLHGEKLEEKVAEMME